MKQLFAISWAMPPMLFPRAIQVARLLKNLQEWGWESTALCANPTAISGDLTIDSSLEQAYQQGFRVVRVAPRLNPYLPRQILKRFFPIENYAWIKNAVRMARQELAARNYHAMISFSEPWWDHLVGLKMGRETGLPWIAHFSDPWVDSPYYQGVSWYHRVYFRRMERTIIREASAVIFVNSQTRDLVMGKYPAAWKEKTHVVPHGYDAEAAAQVEPAAEAHKGLRLVHLGSFYPGLRTPEAFLEALAILSRKRELTDQLEVMLIGANVLLYQPRVQALGVDHLVHCRGPVSFLKSLEIAAAADVLLVIDKPSATPSLFLPSKLVDYLAFKKPILGLTPSGGASADLLRRLRCPMAPPDDPPVIAAVLEDLLQLWQAGNLAVFPGFAQVAQEYDIRQTAGLVANVLGEVTSAGQRKN